MIQAIGMRLFVHMPDVHTLIRAYYAWPYLIYSNSQFVNQNPWELRIVYSLWPFKSQVSVSS